MHHQKTLRHSAVYCCMYKTYVCVCVCVCVCVVAAASANDRASCRHGLLLVDVRDVVDHSGSRCTGSPNTAN